LPATAAEAVAAVQPLAAGHDPEARLAMIVSGEDIDLQGRAYHWELFYLLPNEQARAVFEIRPVPEGDEENGYLKEAVSSFFRGDRSRLSPGVLEELWRKELQEHPPLPVPFRDSPEAVVALEAVGVEFYGGSTYVNLSTRWVDGKPMWEAMSLGETYRVPFAS
jgi:hypothetical protein